MKRKRCSRKFHRGAIERMKDCDNVGQLARELGPHGGTSTGGEVISIWMCEERTRLPAST